MILQIIIDKLTVLNYDAFRMKNKNAARRHQQKKKSGFTAERWARVLLLAFLFGIFLLGTAPLFGDGAEDLPLRDVSEADLRRLEAGERIFTSLDSAEDMRLEGVNTRSSRLIELAEDADPNFLAEIIMYIPVDSERDNLAYIRETLMDVKQFDTIPYYSKEHEKYFPLFEDTEILSRETEGKTETIHTRHGMKPFKPYEAAYTLQEDNHELLFIGRNSSKIRYNRFKAVDEGEFLKILWIRDDGDRLFIYGAGGVNAFTFFGLFGDRMEVSFMGRVDAFFNWYYEEHASSLFKLDE